MIHNAQIFDAIMFFGALAYGWFRNDKLNYSFFKEDRGSLLVFRAMLVMTLFVYCGLAAAGGMSGPWFVVYCLYITALLAWEENVYFKKQQYLVSFTDILAIEVIREVILISGGFWHIH